MAVPQPPSPDPEPGADAELSFPDLPRLALDQLLLQLVDRAQEVMGTQGRLRGLLRASRLVTGELALPILLRRIVVGAQELVGARYAAVGVLAPGGGLAEFLHVGMPEEAVRRIGHLPQGKGLLGALIDEPSPIRLARIADDPRSSGFPPGHPPMASFLGVPIRVRGEVFGNLYLAESTRGGFSAEDEELLTALAATAGIAIDNARLYESARTRGEWLQASAAITRRLLSPDTGDFVHPLRSIAEHCRDIAGADLVVVARPAGEADQLTVGVAVGAGADAVVDRRVPLEGSLMGRVFRTGELDRVARLEDRAGLSALLSGHADVGPVLAVPLLGSRRTHGVLCAARLVGRPAFTAADLDMAGSFANHATLAIELADARAEQERVHLLDDRERIAADLHDHVIQRLSASALSLQGVAGSLGRGPAAERLRHAVDDLDETIRQIRTSIFQLHQEPQPPEAGVLARFMAVLGEASHVLGFETRLHISGRLADTLAEEIVRDLLAVLREGLTNVARHAEARSCEVAVSATADRLSLSVVDDGRGIGSSARQSGFENLRSRARARGGEFTIGPGEASGTRLVWSVPVP